MQLMLLDARATAGILGVSEQTLAKWRVNGDGPRFLKIGSRIRYDRKDLDDWLEQRRRSST